MNENNSAGVPSGISAQALREIDEVWATFERRLTGALIEMADADPGAGLLLELPGVEDEENEITSPYACFTTEAKDLLHAVIPGDAHLLPRHHLGPEADAYLSSHGWHGNDNDQENYVIDRPAGDAASVAHEVVWVLRRYVGVAHPQLMTYRAWGSTTRHADRMGLDRTENVPVDDPRAPGGLVGRLQRGDDRIAVRPKGPEELLEIVGRALREKYSVEVSSDTESRAEFDHGDQRVVISVVPRYPRLEIRARVAHDVPFPVEAAIILGELNSTNAWVTWVLDDDAVWQRSVIPCLPFVPQHLLQVLHVFLKTLDRTRDDLVRRLGAEAA